MTDHSGITKLPADPTSLLHHEALLEMVSDFLTVSVFNKTCWWFQQMARSQSGSLQVWSHTAHCKLNNMSHRIRVCKIWQHLPSTKTPNVSVNLPLTWILWDNMWSIPNIDMKNITNCRSFPPGKPYASRFCVLRYHGKIPL